MNNIKKTILAIDTSTESCSVALSVANNLQVNKTTFASTNTKSSINSNERECNLYARSVVAPNMHSNIILQQIDEVLKEAQIELHQLDALAFANGPGSFTGLRIGASVIQALAFSYKIPVIKISSLQVLAQSALILKNYNMVLSLIDARKGEVYWGLYIKDHKDIMTNISPDLLSSPENVDLSYLCKLTNSNEFLKFNCKDLSNENLFVVGNGMLPYKPIIKKLEHFDCKSTDNMVASEFLVFDDNILYPSAEYMLDIAEQKLLNNEYCDAENVIPTYLRNNIAEKSS